MDNKKQLTAEDFAYLREYGWGGALQGAAVGAMSGAAIGASVSGPAAALGAGIGAVGGAIILGTAGHFAEEATLDAQKEQEQTAAYQKNQSDFWNEQSNTQTGNWSSRMYEEGGNINPVNTPPLEYNGQSHQGPNSGIPIDQQGNPSASTKKQPIALVEDGEVSYKGFIYSDKLKGKDGKTFASRAKKVLSKYKPRLGKNFDRDDAMAQEAMDKELNALANENEQVRAPKDYKKLDEYCKGGRLNKKGEGGFANKLQVKAAGLESSLYPDSEFSSVGYLLGDNNPEDVEQLPEYGDGSRFANFKSSGKFAAITDSAELATDAYSLYQTSRAAADASITQNRIDNQMFESRMKGDINEMNLEDRNYSLRSYQSGGEYRIPISEVDSKKEYSKVIKRSAFDWMANTPREVSEWNDFGDTVMYSPQMVTFDPQEIAERKRTEEYKEIEEKRITAMNSSLDASIAKNQFTVSDDIDEDTLTDIDEEFDDSENYKRTAIPYDKKYNALGFIPGAMNVIRGALGKPEVVNAGDYTLDPSVIRARQYRGAEAIKDAERASYNRLRAYNPASPTANAAQRIAVDVAQQEQLAKTREGIFNVNERLMADADNKRLAIMQRNAQIRMGIDDINAQNRAAQEGLITTGLGQVGQELAGQRQEQNTMALIHSMYPEYEDEYVGTDYQDYEHSKSNKKTRKANTADKYGVHPLDITPVEGFTDREYKRWQRQREKAGLPEMAEGGPIFDFNGPTPDVQSALKNDYAGYTNLPSDTTGRAQRKQQRAYKATMKSDPRFSAYSNKQIRQISKAKIDPNTITPATGYTNTELVNMRNDRNPNVNRMQPAESQGVVGNLPIPEITPRPIDTNITIPNYEAADEYKVNPLDITPAGGFETEAEYKAWQDARVAAGMTKDFEPLTDAPIPEDKSPYDQGYDLYDPLNREGISYTDWEKGQPWFKGDKSVAEASTPQGDTKSPITTEKAAEEAASALEPISNPEDWGYSTDLNQLAGYEGRVIGGKWKDELEAGDKHTIYNDAKSGRRGKDVSWSKDDKEGNPTIGYGHLVTQAELDAGTFDNGLTETEARTLFLKDSKEHNEALYSEHGWIKDAPEGVRKALEDMSFNMGITRFRKFAPTLKLIKEGKYEEAAKRIEKTPYYTKKTTQRQKDVVANIRNA